MSINLDQALEVARKAAKDAAVLAVEYQEKIRPERAGRSLGIDTKMNLRDYVTEADLASQKLIIERLQKHYPDHRVIAEEKGADNIGDPSSPYTWIIDPIDGTTPFIHNRDNFGVMIALQENGETVLGIIWIPRREELFTGIRGQGAFFNGEPVRLRNTQGMNDAILCSNLMHRGEEIDGVLKASYPYCANIENYGSAAHEIGEILKGCNDGVFFLGPRIWDVAPGFMMVEEAGGKCEYVLEDPADVRSEVRGLACTKPIFEELREFVFNKM